MWELGVVMSLTCRETGKALNGTCMMVSRVLLKLVKRDFGGVTTTPPVFAL